MRSSISPSSFHLLSNSSARKGAFRSCPATAAAPVPTRYASAASTNLESRALIAVSSRWALRLPPLDAVLRRCSALAG